MELPEDYDDGDRAAGDWTTPDGTRIRLVLDTIARVAYLDLDGESISAAAQSIRERRRCRELEEILAHAGQVGRSTSQLALDFRQLAVAGPSRPDSRLVAVFDSGVMNPDPDVRHAASIVPIYLHWQELRPGIEQLLSIDPRNANASNALFLIDLSRDDQPEST